MRTRQQSRIKYRQTVSHFTDHRLLEEVDTKLWALYNEPDDPEEQRAERIAILKFECERRGLLSEFKKIDEQKVRESQ